MLKYALIMLTGTFIASVSQIVLKKAAEKEYPNKLAEYLNPMVMGAYVVFFAASLCSVIGYKEVPLSLGPILEATGYIFVPILSMLFLSEKIKRNNIVAIGLIVIGIITFYA